jgi:6-phosphogluconolactonase (cycloisomerase 2 family)
MKLRNLGRVTLALVASLVLIGGMDSCHYDYTEAYVIVTGSQYNQISSYREQADTGKLFAAPGDPQSSVGNDPIRAVLLTGGRYVYVLNHGTATADGSGNLTWKGANISLFSIGGDGGLASQSTYPSEGTGSVRLLLSAGGDFLYVLDEYEPDGTTGQTPASTSYSPATPCYDSTYNVWRPVGDVTVFSIDTTTGQLYLVQNQQLQNASGADLDYFPLGCNPIDFVENSSYLMTAEVSDPANTSDTSGTGAVIGDGEVVYAYQAGTTGQLLQAPGGSQILGGTEGISVINQGPSERYVYVLDAVTNMIYPYTVGSNGLLSAVTGGAIANNGGAGVDEGMDAMTTDAKSEYLYIANTESGGLGLTNSAITAYQINPTSGDLTPPVPEQPFPTGSGPVCIFEDPSNRYVYTADSASSTITGSQIDPNTGILKPLPSGSVFNTVGTPTWCLYSSNTD